MATNGTTLGTYKVILPDRAIEGVHPDLTSITVQRRISVEDAIIAAELIIPALTGHLDPKLVIPVETY